MSFKEAAVELGIQVGDGRASESRRYRTPTRPRRQEDAISPQEKGFTDDVVNSSLWQEKAEKFVSRCHEALLDRPLSLDYLAGRGISEDQVRAFRLGVHLGRDKDSDEWLPDFRPWKAWGLKDEKKQNGRPRMLALPAGIVIPCLDVVGRVRRIRVRLAKPRPQDPKYQVVRGSAGDLLIANAGARVFVLVETELDAIMIDGQTSDQIGSIALGSASAFPNPRAAELLISAAWVLVAGDFDKAGGDPRLRTRWRKMLPRSKRWPPTVGKDPGDMFKAGVNIEAWVLAGLPEGLQGALVGDYVSGRGKVREGGKMSQEGQGGVLPGPSEISADLRKLSGLLADAGASIQVYDHLGGRGIRVACPADFSARVPEASRALHNLVWMSEEVGALLDRVPFGVYSGARIRSVAAGGRYVG